MDDDKPWMTINPDCTDLIGLARIAAQIKSSPRGELEFIRHYKGKLTQVVGHGNDPSEYGFMLFNGQMSAARIRIDFGVELLRVADIKFEPVDTSATKLLLTSCLHPDLASDVMCHLTTLARNGQMDPHYGMCSSGNVFIRRI